MENKNVIATVDEYIAQFSPEVQAELQAFRALIRRNAPEAEEKISWKMPAFVLRGSPVFFAAFPKHIGFYPSADAVEAFQSRLAGYSCFKGTVRFPHGKPLPEELIADMVKFRLLGNGRDAEK